MRPKGRPHTENQLACPARPVWMGNGAKRDGVNSHALELGFAFGEGDVDSDSKWGKGGGEQQSSYWNWKKGNLEAYLCPT
ncbi:hypothetical protein NPIL_101221 [Nephila pilipes]|uniref:Uncharacterized protein n=1 Tax=Nephila pilipes TaxID=299642 RepID=A0A8X6NRL7_NEPPI|nr:hypothetical protein NPIL_101221 [Nephila pilipes]